ncbi:nitric-oxide reductase [Malaciobacter mytili]|uniref:Nitric-oxide reductase n=1 Tax=Malaciobacter mytili LMG 24559 TaxID=1032238 RepID=A0AAX2AL64_9BACT|nr:cbb3-type cytochrome c oxidase subunit I [Malaciobacter mytili]AXH14069.1 nitric oxide reductase, large subunit [Malaciobacter mytili LMG 24559]RXI43434.1 nitric-oxide reductase [Malaciobacter mytili]RXK16948.1 nitric-oxide reductase [Malaciobacter mytili LMG 24559]
MANNLQFESKKLAIKYFTVAAILFGAQLLMGLIAATQFLFPSFLFEVFDFNVARMVHINALVVWMLYAMIGSVYYLLPDETEIETVGIKLGNIAFYILTAAVTVVVLVYILVQVGPATESTIWFINEGREYIEAPRWADIGIVVVVLVFVFNLFATAAKGKQTGIVTVLMADVLALAGLYLAGMFFTENISVDQYWWWWVIHLWVEATWEVFVGCLAAYGLIKIIGARREIVEMWLWIEVTMLFGSGILGLGHHYFWIGTPEYWWEIGALFSALEPVPLVAMFVHVIYDWGKETGLKEGTEEKTMNNTPAFAWFVTNAFGNFLGAGVWGFFHTLPQINIYTHGTQFTSAHGHLAFFGAYATILIGMFYLGLQGKNGIKVLKATFASKMAISLITIGVLGMTVSLTIAGYGQVLVERAQMGATWQAYFISQSLPWFVQGIGWRLVMGVVTFIGFIFLIKDLLTTSKSPRHIY